MAQAYITDRDRRDALVRRIERYTEVPLMLMAFAMVPLLLGHVLFDLSPEEQRVFTILDVVIWSLFAADLAVKVAITTDRPRYLRRRWLQAVIVLLPFFRPLLVLRLVAYGSRAVVGLHRVLNLGNLVVFGIGLVIIGATVMLAVEQGANPRFASFQDALWWAFVTISTVGYGDAVPTTVVGRLVAVVVMLGGVAFFGALAGNLASLLTRKAAEEIEEIGQAEAGQQAVLRELVLEVRALRTEVAVLSGRRAEA